MEAATHPGTPQVGGRRRWRGPFARWPRAADAVLAAALFLASVFLVDGPGDTLVLRPLGELSVATLALFAVGSGALYWRRRMPLLVLAVASASWALAIVAGPADLGGATLVALYSAGRHAPGDRWNQGGLALALGVAGVDALANDTPLGEGLFTLFVMSVAWYVGRRLRLRTERFTAVERERQAETRRIVAEERTRIARELHDVVAHRVSLMTVQAGAAKVVATEDPQAARQAMGEVELAGRQALDELRHLLGVLRPETDGNGLVPQQGLADMPRLVQQLRAAGVDVRVAAGHVPAGLPVRVDLSAFRIVQESLTNVLKHAGAGARAEVRVGASADRRWLGIEVTDDGPAGGEPAAAGIADGGAGHGILGMRERALLLGGHLEATPRPSGGFRVVARLPMDGVSS